MMKTISFLSLIAVTVLCSTNVRAQHGHLEAGAAASTAGSQLIFANGDAFASHHGFVLPLVLATDGPYAGYFHGNITMTVRAATLQRGGPEANHPALGAEISVELIAVEGPPGGTFGFWEHGSVEPTVSLQSGATGTERWLLSESGGAAGADPFGHVHGRRFTADRPGIYTVTFGLHDESSVHEPSDHLQVRFIAGDGISVTTRHEGDYVIGVSYHDGALAAAVREDDGHTDHTHDALNLEKTIFGVRSHNRAVVGAHQEFFGQPGRAVWTLETRMLGEHDPAEETPHGPHQEPGHEAPEEDSHEDPGNGHGHGHGHSHDNNIAWDGAETASIGLEAIADPAGGFNVYLDIAGFEFSPENASRMHVPGQGHGHIFVDGERLGRVYHTEYFVYALSPGEHTILVTLNANTHEDYTLHGNRLEASTTVTVPEPPSESGGGHGHEHGPSTREWDGGPTPVLGLEVHPDPGSGWNLLFDYQGFNLNPRNASQHHVIGEGHTHIYVNGEKLTRLYGNAFHIPSLPPGDVEVAVRLSANDHLEYTLDGQFLEVATTVHNGESHEVVAPLVPLTLTLSTQDLGHDILAEDTLELILTSVAGPGDVILMTPSVRQHGGETSEHGHAAGSRVSSLDGISDHDRIVLRTGSIVPLSWSFTAPGNYQVGLGFAAQQASGAALEQQPLTLSFNVLPSEGLHYAIIGENLHLSWDTGVALQHAATVDGPYHNVESAHGYLQVSLENPMTFFQLAGHSMPHGPGHEEHGAHDHP